MAGLFRNLAMFLDKLVFRSYYRQVAYEQEQSKVMQKFVAARFSRGNVSMQFGRFRATVFQVKAREAV